MNFILSPVKKTVPLTAIIMLSACQTADIHTAESFDTYQTAHKKVAILPFAVTISQTDPEDTNLATLNSAELQEGIVFQKQLYFQFLRKWKKGQYTVDFQDVDETNVLLRRANMAAGNTQNFTKAQIGQALGVDAVISGTIKRKEPTDIGTVLASAFLLGSIGAATNTVNVKMTIHDSAEGSLLWSYDHELKSGLGSSAEGVSRFLMRGTSRNFPYTKEEEE